MWIQNQPDLNPTSLHFLAHISHKRLLTVFRNIQKVVPILESTDAQRADQKKKTGHRVAIPNQQTVLSGYVASSLSMSKIVFPARCRKPPHSPNLSGETGDANVIFFVCVCVCV